jgi:uncharacterized SAM-binding protein YcdF (DUF218 family)
MFFILSKILSFLISPFTYLVVLLLWAWKTKSGVKRKKLISISIIFIFVFGNSFILDEANRIWELPENNTRKNHYDIGIVLSGMINYDAKKNILQFNGNSDRLLQALPLLKAKSLDNLFFSGGSGDLYHPENKEAELIIKYLNSIEFPIKNIFIENESKNTYQNAMFSKEKLTKIFKDLTSKKILLITSSLHMRRSLACFKKQGIECEYLSTNRKSGPRKFEFQHCLIPNIGALSGWNHLGHEVIGYFSYKLTGRL